MRSPGFSSMRPLLDSWDEFLAEEDRQNRIQAALNSPNIVLFFVEDNQVYGAPEDSRVIFARMKAKGDEDGEKWKKDADFMAFNLSTLDDGRVTQSVFGKKDLRKIKVIEKEEAERRLMSQPKSSKKQAKVISIVVPNHEEK